AEDSAKTQPFDFDLDTKDLSLKIDQLDAFSDDNAPVEPDSAAIPAAAAESAPEEPPAEALVSAPAVLSSAQLDEVVERVIEQKYSEKIENLIVQVIEKAVSKEIEKLKKLLLEDDEDV
ncbi:MAG: hypothetical protein JSW39_01705, partial [Desulfobacterales bacterium]